MVCTLKKIVGRRKILGIHSLLVMTVLSLSLSYSVTSNLYEGTYLGTMNVSRSQPYNTSQIDWSETTKMIVSDGESNDWFGISVAIDGNYCVVGARDDDGERGSAYVFRCDENQWIQDQKLLAADGVAGDWFGISVAILGDYIFVGADADDNENGVNAGSVYVFRHNDSSWSQQDMLLASDGAANDYFGRYISLNGEYAVIGAYYDNDITGSAYVFKRIGNDWVEEDKLIASDGEPGDYFGISTSIYGDYTIIGAYRDDNINGIDAGSAYLFRRTSSGWVEEDRILASDGVSSDRFGISTSLDGGNIIIGAYYDDAYTGSAYVFKNTATGWVEETKLFASDGGINDFFGRSVSIDDEYAIVGAWGDKSSSGSVYIFRHTDTMWVEESKLYASDAASNDRFGYQVSLNGNTVIIGANLDDNVNGIDAGSAYVFTRETENQPPRRPTIDGPACGKIGTSYEYSFNVTDPDDDEVYYFIEWDDNSSEAWIGSFSSGEPTTVSHTWTKKDTYVIKAKAKDSHGEESEWATLEVSMPYCTFFNRLLDYPLLSWFIELFPQAFPLLRLLMKT